MHFDFFEHYLVSGRLSDVLRFAQAKAALQDVREEGDRESQRITVRPENSEDAPTVKPSR